MDRSRRAARLVVLAAAFLAVACSGGGGDKTTPAPSCVNGSACTRASPAACTTYAKTCAADGSFTCNAAGSAADGTSCGISEVCASGSCVAACVAASSCTPGSPDACKTYGKTCNGTLTDFTCDPVGNAADGTSCGSGEVCSTGNCVAACVAASSCTPASPDACKTYGKTCNLTLTGFSCDPVGIAADGTTCGSGNVCSAGSCVAACVAGSSCTPASPDACKTYGKTCTANLTGFTCDAVGNAAEGTTCGSGQVCSTGSCVAACVGGGACTPAGTPDACKTYTNVCNGTLTGSTCEATGNATDGTDCGSGNVCSSGSCIAACVPGSSCTPAGTPDACKTYTATCSGGLVASCDATGNAADGTACGGGNSCAAGVCQAPCAHATVRTPAGGAAPAWSAEFATWLGANGYAHVAANQGWGGGTGCEGGASVRLPVVMIHGNSNAADPSVSFNALKTKLLANGYTACDLFAISWIDQNADTSVNHHKANYLKLVRDFIQAVQGYTGKSQVQVVGWSMGVTISRKAIKGGIAYSDAARTQGCDLGPSLATGVETFLGVAGLNRGYNACSLDSLGTSDACSDNGFKIDGAFLRDINGGSGGTYAPAAMADHVYSIYLPADGYICGDDPRGRGPLACEVYGTHTSIVPGSEFERSYDLPNEDYGYNFGLNFNCTPDQFGRASNCDHILAFNDQFSLDGMLRILRDHTTTGLPAPAFAQADLAGDWETVRLETNDVPGWQAASVSIDGTGTATFTNVEASDGTTSSSAITLEMDDNGVVTLLDPLNLTSFHGKLSQDKNLLVATYGSPAAGSRSGLLLLSRRAAGVTYAAADVSNLAFRLVQLQVGGSTDWEFGTGTTDAGGALSLSSLDSASGPLAPPSPAFATFDIDDATGRVGLVGNPAFRGVMTPDKAAIFSVQTVAPTVHVLTVFLVTGQTFAEADLAGAYEVPMLTSGPAAASSSWGYGRVGIGNTGATGFRYWMTPAGTSLPNIGTLTIDAGGTITSSGNATYRGQMAWNKDWYVRIQTLSGARTLAIALR